MKRETVRRNDRLPQSNDFNGIVRPNLYQENPPLLADITASTFKPGEILSVALDDNNEYTLTLEKVHLANYKGRSGQRDPFTLLFTGSTNFVLPQGMHTVTHGTMGTFPLFLVPVVPQDSGRHYYEACFS